MSLRGDMGEWVSTDTIRARGRTSRVGQFDTRFIFVDRNEMSAEIVLAREGSSASCVCAHVWLEAIGVMCAHVSLEVECPRKRCRWESDGIRGWTIQEARPTQYDMNADHACHHMDPYF